MPLGAPRFSDAMLCLHLGVQAGETGTTLSWAPLSQQAPQPHEAMSSQVGAGFRYCPIPHMPPPSLAPTPTLDE